MYMVQSHFNSFVELIYSHFVELFRFCNSQKQLEMQILTN
ncbi:hypothetical protein Rmar_0172 [Rhodothermus marinus DSM 4252]|uniref:Uncharacterized protein n=1 Tax=Rhodothermus marinus (strain ATCC 43812 / DSM 4252 / R-10) TaxID=518766 RepID=D0MCX0_RHOM4|nr:hypothetical protein Rmar_0172 [Rhodothermus marinus DSM 4252]